MRKIRPSTIAKRVRTPRSLPFLLLLRVGQRWRRLLDSANGHGRGQGRQASLESPEVSSEWMGAEPRGPSRPSFPRAARVASSKHDRGQVVVGSVARCPLTIITINTDMVKLASVVKCFQAPEEKGRQAANAVSSLLI